MGSAAPSVESVRLNPERKRNMLLRAAEQHISVSEAIPRAIGKTSGPADAIPVPVTPPAAGNTSTRYANCCWDGGDSLSA